jgi:hypothetical protein
MNGFPYMPFKGVVGILFFSEQYFWPKTGIF